jgi:Transcriptional regulator containing GAF, AAA-type ATPase, and DNA binding domains
MDWFMSYTWPGNIRELQNIIERAVVLAQGSTIEINESMPGMNIGSRAPVSDKIGDMDRAHILRVLKDANWKVHGKGGAASILGINPSTLRSRMQKLGIKRPGRSS